MRRWLLALFAVATGVSAVYWSPEDESWLLWFILAAAAITASLMRGTLTGVREVEAAAAPREADAQSAVGATLPSAPDGSETDGSETDGILSPVAAAAGTVSSSGREPDGTHPYLGLMGIGLLAIGTALHMQPYPRLGFLAWLIALPMLGFAGARDRASLVGLEKRLGLILVVAWSAYFVALAPPFWNTPRSLFNWEEYTVGGLLGRYRGEYAPVHTEIEYGMLYAPKELLETSLPWNQGLMTDSYRVLLGGTPAALFMRIFGVSLFSLRFYSVFMSLAGVLLLAWFIRSLGLSRSAGRAAGMLMAATPVFLVYGRTGTDVGPALTWSILILGLWSTVAWGEGRRWAASLGLGAAMSLSAYFYATLRLEVAALAAWIILWGGLVLRRWSRLFLVLTGFLLLSLPQIQHLTEIRANFFAGRGEQLIAMSEHHDELQKMFPGEPLPNPIPTELRLRFIAKYMANNLVGWYRIFVGVDLNTPVSDYWNPRGEMLHPVLLCLALGGLAVSWRRLGFQRSAFLLLTFAATALPSLMTNNVHAGRLLLALPVLMVWVLLCVWAIVDWIGSILRGRIIALNLAIAGLLVFAGWHNFEDFVKPLRRADFPHPAYQVPIADALRGHEQARVVIPPRALEPPAIQFLAFPTHRVILDGKPLVPFDSGPQPGPGTLRYYESDCAGARALLAPGGAGPLYVQSECLDEFLHDGVRPVSIPGTGEYVEIRAEMPSAPTGNVVWLADLTPEDVNCEFAPPNMNHTWNGQPIVMEDAIYPHGIGAHAPCTMTFEIPEGATKFQAVVGLTDGIRSCEAALVSFEVHDDTGARVFDSGPIGPSNAPQPVNVPLHGKKLVLAITDGGNGRDCDHANWGDPAFVLKQ